MSEKRVIKMGSGDYRETTVKDNATYVEGNYYSSSQSQEDLTAIRLCLPLRDRRRDKPITHLFCK